MTEWKTLNTNKLGKNKQKTKCFQSFLLGEGPGCGTIRTATREQTGSSDNVSAQMNAMKTVAIKQDMVADQKLPNPEYFILHDALPLHDNRLA